MYNQDVKFRPIITDCFIDVILIFIGQYTDAYTSMSEL